MAKSMILGREWSGHFAGIWLTWTRLVAPWALLAGWLGSGLSAAALAPLAVAPLAAGLYAAGYVLARTLRVLTVWRLKAADGLLLGGATLVAVALVGAVLPTAVAAVLWLPGAALVVQVWVLTWYRLGPGERTRRTGGSVARSPVPPLFVPPVQGPVVAGYQSYSRTHGGVDVGVAVGTPVLAPAHGLVAHAGPLGQWGWCVLLDHDQGWSTLLAHLERPGVRAGAYVRAGSVVGWSGTSGVSTGPHVHVELRYKGQPVDPASLLAGGYAQTEG